MSSKQLNLTCLLIMVAMGVTMPLYSYAQSTNFSLNKRLDVMEKELKAVQRKVFTPGSEFPQGQSSATPSSQSNVSSGVPIADIEVRISQIETEIRQLTGRIEESNFQVNSLKQTMETMARDYEFRLKELENNTASGSANSNAVSGNANSGAYNNSAAGNDMNASGNTAGAGMPAGSEQEQYSYAQKLVTMGQYDQAETALNEFIKRYPKTDLTGNAQYWLGQTYYVRKMYPKATRAFLEGYNNYPKSQKAPAFLLKIGMSLFAMGEKTDACDAYRELGARFPDSIENKNKRLSEEKRAGCR